MAGLRINIVSMIAGFMGLTPTGVMAEGATGRLESTVLAGSCSAVLIRQDVALTAAHCVMPDRDWYIFRPGDGDFPGLTHQVTTVARLPMYEAEGRSLSRLRFDMAILRLDQAVPDQRLHAATPGAPARPGETLVVESWRRDGTQSPTRRRCVVTDDVSEHVSLACQVERGDSGAGVFRVAGQRQELVAIVTARFMIDGRDIALAVNVEDHLAQLTALIETK